MKTIHAILAAAVAASFMPAAVQAAPTYQLIRLESFGGSIAAGLGLNASGTVVGHAHTEPCCDDVAPYETRRAVRWTASNPADLGTLGGMNASAHGVNDQNVVVGTSALAGGGNDLATTWVNGVATQLPNLGGQASGAYAINRRGDIAGYATTPGNVRYRAVVWRGGVARALPDLGGKNAVATALSNKGHVVGYSTTRDQQSSRAVMWSSAGGLTNLGAGLAGSSGARGVNDRGTAVGYHMVPDAFARPIIWNGTTPVDVGTARRRAGLGQRDQQPGLGGRCQLKGRHRMAARHAVAGRRGPRPERPGRSLPAEPQRVAADRSHGHQQPRRNHRRDAPGLGIRRARLPVEAAVAALIAVMA